MAIVRRRPEGWTKDGVLTLLAREQEIQPPSLRRGIGDLLADVAEKDPIVTANTLMSDLTKWRALDADFRDRYFALMPAGARALGDSVRGRKLDFAPGVEDYCLDYCKAYMELGTKAAAAERIGRNLNWVNEQLRVGGPQYNERFADLWKQTLAIEVDRLEGYVDEGIETARTNGDMKTMLWGAFRKLEAVSEQWMRREKREHIGTVVHLHHAEQRRSQALAAAGNMSRKLFGPAAEGDVVEVEEVIEVEVARP